MRWVIICELVGILGSIVTFPNISTWYQALQKPPFNPPNYIFGPVWTVLYALMGCAMHRVWRLGMQKKAVRDAVILFIIHLGVNFLWSFLFFSLHSVFGALVDILFLWVLIGMLVIRFKKLDALSGYLLVPYFLWVSFATVLNASIWFLNP